jgi:TonB family protein
MAETPRPTDPNAPKSAHTIRPHTTVEHEGGGNAWKWVAGAAAAAVVLGVGFVALTQNKSPQAEIAYNETATDQNADRYAGPLPGAERSPADVAADDEANVQTAAVAPTPAPRRERARTTTPAASEPVVIEQTIGVGSDGVVAENASADENIIVHSRLRPQWTRTPSAYRMAAAYPDRALERGREGEARVACTVLDTGRLDCARVSEYPAKYGFGRAAVRVAQQYRHDTLRADGQPAAGTPVNFRVLFRVAEERHASLN